MKTKLMTLVMVFGLAIFTNAQSNQNSIPEQKVGQVTVQVNNSAGEVKSFNGQNKTTQTSASAKESTQKKKKKKLKTWQYIVGGVLIAVILVFTVIAPDGYNSRSGI